jgi:3' terminal RNA ribose 2'-O-methyltransferase Hen1
VLLTLTTTAPPATDLGFLLHKNPARLHTVSLPFGEAHVAYPVADDAECTAAVVVDVDPVGLVRGRKGPSGNEFALDQYVNDRPYAASSFLSVALLKLFGTAMSGRCKEKPELADTPMPLRVTLPVVPCRGGDAVPARLFEPLGYAVEAERLPLDTRFPQWGDSRYYRLTLHVTAKVRDLLEHLFVLLPVLDDDKHYWVGDDEVDKLLRRGGAWLADHPERELIARRYLRHDRRLTRDALARLAAADDGADDPDAEADAEAAEEEAVEDRISLNEHRQRAVLAAITAGRAQSVVDLGCGGGQLLARLLRDTKVDRIVGMDVSHRALEAAARRLHLATMAPRQRQRIELVQGALTYRDKRLRGFDVATAVEVVEHLDPPRLGAFERAVFADAKPRCVIVTTPNVEFNTRFETLPAGSLRHRDHRFEWTRKEFGAWATEVAERNGYQVAFEPVGEVDPEVGPPTQMAVFRR